MGSSGDRQALADGVQGRSSQCDHPEISGWLLNPVPSILRKEETRRGHAGRRPCESGSREIGGGGCSHQSRATWNHRKVGETRVLLEGQRAHSPAGALVPRFRPAEL